MSVDYNIVEADPGVVFVVFEMEKLEKLNVAVVVVVVDVDNYHYSHVVDSNY